MLAGVLASCGKTGSADCEDPSEVIGPFLEKYKDADPDAVFADPEEFIDGLDNCFRPLSVKRETVLSYLADWDETEFVDVYGKVVDLFGAPAAVMCAFYDTSDEDIVKCLFSLSLSDDIGLDGEKLYAAAKSLCEYELERAEPKSVRIGEEEDRSADDLRKLLDAGEEKPFLVKFDRFKIDFYSFQDVRILRLG